MIEILLQGFQSKVPIAYHMPFKKILSLQIQERTDLIFRQMENTTNRCVFGSHIVTKVFAINGRNAEIALRRKRQGFRMNFENQRMKKKIKRMKDAENEDGDNNTSNSPSVIFRTTFGGSVNQPVCVDIGADVNLMDEKLFQKFDNQKTNFNLENLSNPVIYELAEKDENGSTAKIKCDKKITLDMKLHIRHGTSLILRNVACYIIAQSVTDPLLGRLVLEALGLNTEYI